jgi:hypothetical protein
MVLMNTLWPKGRGLMKQQETHGIIGLNIAKTFVAYEP